MGNILKKTFLSSYALFETYSSSYRYYPKAGLLLGKSRNISLLMSIKTKKNFTTLNPSPVYLESRFPISSTLKSMPSWKVKNSKKNFKKCSEAFLYVLPFT